MSEYIDQKRKSALRAYVISIPILLILAIACLFIGLKFPDRFVHSDMIFSMGFGLIAATAVVFLKFLYWKKNKDAHERQLQDEKIRFSDERKIMLRQKSSQTTYMLTLVGLYILNMSFIFMDVELKIIMAIWIFLAADVLLGIIIFKYYSNKM